MDEFTKITTVRKAWWDKYKDISFSLVGMLAVAFTILVGLNLKASNEIAKAQSKAAIVAERARAVQTVQVEKEKVVVAEQKKEIAAATVEIVATEVKKVEQTKVVVKHIQTVAKTKVAVVQAKTPVNEQVFKESVIAVDALWDTYCSLETYKKEMCHV